MYFVNVAMPVLHKASVGAVLRVVYAMYVSLLARPKQARYSIKSVQLGSLVAFSFLSAS
jgi:hypothetical protein